MGDKTLDLTTGNLWKKMLVFAVPLVLTNLVQAIYNISDMIIVGQFAGATGLTAAGNGSQVMLLILYIILGLANGGSVVAARMFGAGEKERIPKVYGTMFLFFLALALVLTVVVILFTHPILHAMQTPSEAYGQTVWYLRICMLGTVFIYLYNMVSGVLRGIGNSRLPMILVIMTSIINIVLDLLFVGVFDWSASGAAIATLISQILCAILIISLAGKQHPFIRLRKELLHMDRDILGSIIRIGIPQSMQFILTALSFLLVLSLVNRFGNDASAVSVSVTRLGSFAVMAAQAMMGAIAAMTGQNLAVGQSSRSLKGMGIGILYAIPLAMLFFLLSELAPTAMLRLFTKEAGVLTIGPHYLQILAISFLIETFMFCMYGLMTGAGYTLVTMSCAIVSGFAVRFVLASIFGFLTPLGFYGIAWAYVLAPIASTIICLIFIHSGRWKTMRR